MQSATVLAAPFSMEQLDEAQRAGVVKITEPRGPKVDQAIGED